MCELVGEPVAALGLQGLDRFGDLLFIAGADGDIGAFTGQRAGNGTPDAARAAKDDGVLSFEMQIHFGFLQ